MRFIKVILPLVFILILNSIDSFSIDYNFKNKPLSDALAEVSATDGVSISYKTSDIIAAPNVTAKTKGLKAIETINFILPSNLTARLVGDIIIITSKDSKVEKVAIKRSPVENVRWVSSTSEIVETTDTIYEKNTTIVNDTIYESHTLAMPYDTLLCALEEKNADYITPYIICGYGSFLQNTKASLRGGFCYGGGIEYKHFFKKHYGIGVGLELFEMQSVRRFQDARIVDYESVDSEGESCFKITETTGAVQDISGLYINIPVSFTYKALVADNWELFSSVAFVLGFSVNGKCEYTSGTQSVSGYYPQWDLPIKDLPTHGYGTTKLTGTFESINHGINYGCGVDLGFVYSVKRNVAIAASLFGRYGYGSPSSTYSIGVKFAIPLCIMRDK